MQKIISYLLLFSLLSCLADDGVENPQYNGTGGPNPADFTGERVKLLKGVWRLDAYETSKITTENVLLEFKTQKAASNKYVLSGILPVNFVEAGYSLAYTNEITIDNISTTKINGSAAERAFEEDFLKRLGGVQLFAFRENTLILSNRTGMQMYFVLK